MPVRKRLRNGIARFELVPDIAEQLRQHVLERQQTGGAAELVHHQRKMRPPLPQLADHLVHRHAFMDAGDRPQQAGQRLVARRRSRASARGPSCEACRRCCRSSRGKPAAVKTGSAATKAMTSAIGVLMSMAEIFRRGTMSCFACRRLSRSARCSRRCSSGSSRPPSRLSAISSSISSGEWMWRCDWDGDPISRSSKQARAVEPLDERPVQPQRRHHRDQRVERGLGRVLERQRLGHELREDDLRHGQDEQHHRRGRRLRRDALQPAPLDEEGLHPHRNRALRERAEHEAGERDADLAGGDVAIEIRRRLDQRQQPRRERVPVVGQLLDAAAPHADRGELRADVDGVDEDQRRDNEDGRKDHVGRSAGFSAC